jgi:hypothetical protein
LLMMAAIPSFCGAPAVASGPRLSLAEREEIPLDVAARESLRAIARRLGVRSARC